MLRKGAKAHGERLRQHTKHTNTSDQVAVLKDAAHLCNNEVRMQAASNATTNQHAMHSAHDRVRECTQLHKAFIHLAQTESKASVRH